MITSTIVHDVGCDRGDTGAKSASPLVGDPLALGSPKVQLAHERRC